MAAIIPWLARILALLAEVLGGVQAIRGIVDALSGPGNKTALESVPYRIDTATQGIIQDVRDPDFGLEALAADIARIRYDPAPDALPDLTAILAAITGLTPVTLPPSPPPGYGGTTIDDVLSWQMCALD